MQGWEAMHRTLSLPLIYAEALGQLSWPTLSSSCWDLTLFTHKTGAFGDLGLGFLMEFPNLRKGCQPWA